VTDVLFFLSPVCAYFGRPTQYNQRLWLFGISIIQ